MAAVKAGAFFIKNNGAYRGSEVHAATYLHDVLKCLPYKNTSYYAA